MSDQRSDAACTVDNSLQTLQAISTRLFSDAGLDALCSEVVSGAKQLMGADAASLQLYDPGSNSLTLLAWMGSHADAAAFWHRVDVDSCSACGRALQTRQRVIVSDMQSWDSAQGSPDAREYCRSGLRSMQSTPLLSRCGRPLGILSTHWQQPHVPCERDLLSLDIIARQAADLVERTQTDATLRASEQRQAFLLQLADGLRPLADANRIKATATRILGEHLGVDRVLYAERPLQDRDDHWLVDNVYHRPAYPFPEGLYVLRDFGSKACEMLRGRTVVSNDVLDDPGVEPYAKENLRKASIAAYVGVPLVKDGRLVAMLVLHHVRPRAWRPDELALLEETAERTWSAVERARAEEALAKSEAKYRALFESIDEGFVVCDLLYTADREPCDLVVLETNPSFYRMMRTEDAVGKRALEIFPNAEASWFEAFGRVVESGQSMRFENYLAALDRWFDLYISRVGGEGSRRLAIVFQDVTVRKRNEHNQRFLIDLDRRLGELKEPDEIEQFTIDSLGAFLKVSRCYFPHIHDNNRATIEHEYRDPDTTVSIVVERRLAEYLTPKAIEQFLRGQTMVCNDVAADPRTAHGTDDYASLQIRAFAAVPVFHQGTWVGIVNVTSRGPRVWREDELEVLRETGARLYPLIQRARAEQALRASEARLQEADRRKDEFLAVLSHELRNPLTPIRNSLYILDHVAPGGDQARRAQAVMARQTEQLARLVDDLLDVTRIARNRIELQRQRVELNELARRTIEDYRTLFERAAVHVHFDPASEPVRVYADRNRLGQIVGNLLQNAAKFTPREGQVSVRVAIERPANRATVSVVDTGIGMTREMLSRLFEPFAQADTSLDRSKGGLGLGLALAKGLVELHGGEMSAWSPGPSKGSEFVVRLPLDMTESSATEATSPTGPTGRRRVLVIEDNTDAANSLRELLELIEHEVEVAYTGPEGIAKAHAFKPDIVLCDIGLPVMDGYAVARAFRSDKALKQVHLIALSGYALPQDLQRAAEAGFERHLAKPPKLETLQNTLSCATTPHCPENHPSP